MDTYRALTPGEIAALEASGSTADGKKLMELTMPEGSLIGLLDRGGEMLIPTGQTELRGGDKIIIFGTAASMEAALAIFG